MIITRENTNNNIINPTSIVKLIKNQKQSAFEKFYRMLESDLGCTYLFYIYEDVTHDKKIIFTSNWEWQNRLIGEKLINNCPIFKAGSQAFSSGKKSIILPWNHIHCETALEKEITLFRSEFNIANGIGLSHSNGIIREGLGLGADIYDYNFYHRVLKNNLLYGILKKARSLALQNIICPTIH